MKKRHVHISSLHIVLHINLHSAYYIAYSAHYFAYSLYKKGYTGMQILHIVLHIVLHILHLNLHILHIILHVLYTKKCRCISCICILICIFCLLYHIFCLFTCKFCILFLVLFSASGLLKHHCDTLWMWAFLRKPKYFISQWDPGKHTPAFAPPWADCSWRPNQQINCTKCTIGQVCEICRI